ncbi:dolichol monophosphate mannose synthase [Legionella erythra]|uniref:Dolichol monophosphate mannose synthase n=2 Tax=Legionella erythra TaxID=448 RepID=A0A0W0TJI8_LEGER|nr:dolichol monophosphate mannose synthase [Legionella erythra]
MHVVCDYQLNVMLKKNQQLCSTLGNDVSGFANSDTFQSEPSLRPLLYITLYILVFLLIRLFLRGHALEIDEAEQLVMARELAFGYPFQPPLYTWLQYGVFQLFGHNLFSLAILKYTLFLGCLCSYFKLCRYYCSNSALAWSALCAWTLIPAISFDLIKDNTHSILALLLACLTWLWFFTVKKNNVAWYAVLGILIGAGCLSKFNYLLFLAALIITALSLPANRQRLINWRLGVTLLMILLIVSPYGLWLWQHHALGLQSSYKLAPEEKSLAHGLYKYLLSVILFTTPLFLFSSLFFSVPKRDALKTTLHPLFRYFTCSVLLVLAVVLVSGFKEFLGRWLIPVLFMCPLLFFSLLNQHQSWEKQAKRFIVFCLMWQLLIIILVIGRAQSGHQANREHAFTQLAQSIEQHCSKPDYFYAANHFMLGTMSWHFPHAQIELQRGNDKPLAFKGGNGVLLWGPEEPPFWINHFKEGASMGGTINSVNPANGELFAHFICLKG